VRAGWPGRIVAWEEALAVPNIQSIKTFLAIAEAGSFAGAARAVYRTQSAVTMQVKALEQSLGMELFDRSRRPPILNDAGRAFAEKAKEVVQGFDRLFEEVNDEVIGGHLRLGVVPSAITGLIPKALVALRSKYPELHIELTMGQSAELVKQVRQGILDAAVVSELQESRSGLQWFPFAREPLVLIAPMDAPDHSAAQLLASYPFIRYTRAAWVGELIDRFIKRRRLVINETIMLDTLEAITTMVHYGLGVSIVPLRGTTAAIDLPVRRIAFEGAPVLRVVGLVQATGHPKTTLAEALLAELKAISGSAAVRPTRAKRAGRGTTKKRRKHKKTES
jgi:DNA-binding transcriptional LysR family regulator